MWRENKWRIRVRNVTLYHIVQHIATKVKNSPLDLIVWYEMKKLSIKKDLLTKLVGFYMSLTRENTLAVIVFCATTVVHLKDLVVFCWEPPLQKAGERGKKMGTPSPFLSPPLPSTLTIIVSKLMVNAIYVVLKAMWVIIFFICMCYVCTILIEGFWLLEVRRWTSQCCWCGWEGYSGAMKV